MKEAISKSIYYSSSSSYSLIATFTYSDPYEFASIMQDLRTNLALRNFFGEKNIVYDICQNIHYTDLLMEQLDGLYIVTRRDNAIRIVKKDATSDNYGIIKIDSVISELAELSELSPKKSVFRLALYTLSYPFLLALGAGIYHGYLSFKND